MRPEVTPGVWSVGLTELFGPAELAGFTLSG
jgi:hypothetical protein